MAAQPNKALKRELMPYKTLGKLLLGIVVSIVTIPFVLSLLFPSQFALSWHDQDVYDRPYEQGVVGTGGCEYKYYGALLKSDPTINFSVYKKLECP